jgi:hypothetical protein
VRASAFRIPLIGPFVGENLLLISIACVSVIMFFVRYTLFRKVTFAPEDGAREEP